MAKYQIYFQVLIVLDILFCIYLLFGDQPKWGVMMKVIWRFVMELSDKKDPKIGNTNQESPYDRYANISESFVGSFRDSNAEIERKKKEARREYNAKRRAIDFQLNPMVNWRVWVKVIATILLLIHYWLIKSIIILCQ